MSIIEWNDFLASTDLKNDSRIDNESKHSLHIDNDGNIYKNIKEDPQSIAIVQTQKLTEKKVQEITQEKLRKQNLYLGSSDHSEWIHHRTISDQTTTPQETDKKVSQASLKGQKKVKETKLQRALSLEFQVELNIFFNSIDILSFEADIKLKKFIINEIEKLSQNKLTKYDRKNISEYLECLNNYRNDYYKCVTLIKEIKCKTREFILNYSKKLQENYSDYKAVSLLDWIHIIKGYPDDCIGLNGHQVIIFERENPGKLTCRLLTYEEIEQITTEKMTNADQATTLQALTVLEKLKMKKSEEKSSALSKISDLTQEEESEEKTQKSQDRPQIIGIQTRDFLENSPFWKEKNSNFKEKGVNLLADHIISRIENLCEIQLNSLEKGVLKVQCQKWAKKYQKEQITIENIKNEINELLLHCQNYLSYSLLNFDSWINYIKPFKIFEPRIQAAFFARFFSLCSFDEAFFQGLNSLTRQIDFSAANKFLVKKACRVLEGETLTFSQKIKIIKKIIGNFKHSIYLLLTRLKQNKEEIMVCFNIKDFKIKKIKPLGDETHNRNIGPLKVVFEEGKTIVYKPRSLLPEAVITGTKESVFAKARLCRSYREWKEDFKTGELLSTYMVLNRGNYGFCEYLENKQEDNTIKRKHLKEYVLKFFLLDKFAHIFGMSDLHADNLITMRVCPFLSDLEVIMLPTESKMYATHLLEGPMAGLYWFPQNEKGTNKVWIIYGKGEIPQCDSSDCQSIRKTIATDGDNSKEKTKIQAILSENQDEITQAKLILNKEKHRFILIPTDDLRNLLLFWNKENALKKFKEFLKLCAEMWGAQLLKNVDDFIDQQFSNDFDNNDVPVFYIDGSKNIYYSNKIIAKIESC
jgi:hypothetical protein